MEWLVKWANSTYPSRMEWLVKRTNSTYPSRMEWLVKRTNSAYPSRMEWLVTRTYSTYPSREEQMEMRQTVALCVGNTNTLTECCRRRWNDSSFLALNLALDRKKFAYGIKSEQVITQARRSLVDVSTPFLFFFFSQLFCACVTRDQFAPALVKASRQHNDHTNKP